MKRYFFLIFLFLFSCSSGFYSCYDGPSCKEMVDRLMKQPGKIRDLLDDTVITTARFRSLSKNDISKFILMAHIDFNRTYTIYEDEKVTFGSGWGKNRVSDPGYFIQIKNSKGDKSIIFYFRLRNGCYKLHDLLLEEPHIDEPLHYNE